MLPHRNARSSHARAQPIHKTKPWSKKPVYSLTFVLSLFWITAISLETLLLRPAVDPDQAQQASAQAHSPVIAVASSMASASEAIARAFYAKTNTTVRISSGASGNLARQIMRGAPFELFISADASYPMRIQDAGFASGAPRTYATGQLALVVSRPGASMMATKASISALLMRPDRQPIALANPEHAPYGRAAREALEFLHLWSSLSANLILGESVAQTARFALTNTVQSAFLPLGMVKHSPLREADYLVIPAAWHAPLQQQMVLIKDASPQARQLFDFILSAQGRAILHEYALLTEHKRIIELAQSFRLKTSARGPGRR